MQPHAGHFHGVHPARKDVNRFSQGKRRPHERARPLPLHRTFVEAPLARDHQVGRGKTLLNPQPIAHQLET